MSPKLRDRLGSLLMLAFVAALWAQRDYISPFGGMFPDTIMILTAAAVILTLVLSFTRYAAMPDTPSPEKDAAPPDHARQSIGRVIVVVILLALWVGLYRTAGFAITGTLGFAAIAWYLADPEHPLRELLKSLGFGVLISFVIYMVFDYFLLVPLPPGFLFN